MTLATQLRSDEDREMLGSGLCAPRLAPLEDRQKDTSLRSYVNVSRTGSLLVKYVRDSVAVACLQLVAALEPRALLFAEVGPALPIASEVEKAPLGTDFSL